MHNCDPEGGYRFLQRCSAALSLVLILLPGLVWALPDDRDQPIHITADQAVRDERQGYTVYSGDVQMNQGSMHIEADKLTIYHIREEADKIVAEGNPAKMRQRPDLEKGPVHARAGVIEYFKREEIIRLKTDARIEQDGATVAGDSIDYFIAEQLVKADSDQARAGNRVQVVIPPSAQQSIGIATPDTPVEADEPPQIEQTDATSDSETSTAAATAAAPDMVQQPDPETAQQAEPKAVQQAEEDASGAADSE